MREVNFLQNLHTSTKRDYLERMTAEKPSCMRIAKQWGHDYWDGDRKYGYGGYKYDGRWQSVAEKMIKHYNLTSDSSILDIGCGKGHLAWEIRNILKIQLEIDAKSFGICGIDISEYALENSPREIRKNINTIIWNGDCKKLPWGSDIFDLSYSINVFHNLGYKDLKSAIKGMVRVTKPDGNSYICIESYRNEEELCNLQMWALTCQSFYSQDDWENILSDNGYSGDVEFIYFT